MVSAPYANAEVPETGCRRHPDGESLTIWCRAIVERIAVGVEDLAVERSLAYAQLWGMDIEHDVNDASAVVQDEIVGRWIACGVEACPVDLITHAIKPAGHVGGKCE